VRGFHLSVSWRVAFARANQWLLATLRLRSLGQEKRGGPRDEAEPIETDRLTEKPPSAHAAEIVILGA
jgi:hypothetical protein